jgi:hypothetical protein
MATDKTAREKSGRVLNDYRIFACSDRVSGFSITVNEIQPAIIVTNKHANANKSVFAAGKANDVNL